MKRRDFIKFMAAAMAATAVGVNVTSCGESNGKKRLIFFFTGTGNSLFVAKEIGGQLISIPQALKQDELSYTADEIGIVCPLYGHTPPNQVREFLKRAKLNAPYMFVVQTYGARKCNAVEIFDALAQKEGIKFDYLTTIIMVDNFLVSHDIDEEIQMEKHIEENLAQIKADIAEQKHWMQPVTEVERQQHWERYGHDFERYSYQNPSRTFRVERDLCVGCGACTRVCPKSNWKFTNNGLEVDGDCQMCFACINNCPQKAIKLNGREANPNARWRHPKITLQELQRANHIIA
ncbi:MAG: EFR1 family ferrodoxin [Bacteroidaceae bacterium]|nr:EFR1 family ferrodoxin [Bacteroidaceae bacterium]